MLHKTVKWVSAILSPIPFISKSHKFLLVVYFASGLFQLMAQPPIPSGECTRTTMYFNSATNVSTSIPVLSGTNQGSGTWEAWVKKEDWSAYNVDEKLFMNDYDFPASSAFYISLHGAVGLHFRSSGGPTDYISNALVFGFAANSWHHLAATWSESGGILTMTIYIDGVTAGTTTSSNLFDLGSAFYLGGKDGSYKFRNGEMAEIRVWDYARSETEISNDRHELMTGEESGLIAYWPLNETIGSTSVTDFISNNVDPIGYPNAASGWRELPLTVKQGDSFLMDGITVDFGQQMTSTGFATKLFTITNHGSETITLAPDAMSALSGTNPGEFSVDFSSTATSLAGGASTTFSVTFGPETSGVMSAELSVDLNDNCENPYLINLTGLGSTLASSITVDANVSIFNTSDGSLTAVPSGGVSPYTYLWNTGATSASISGLAAGDYSVTITDAAGAIATSASTITQPDELLAYITVDSDVTTIGGSDGQLTASGTGGVGNYSFAWDNSATTATISDLAAGSYTVTITDENGAAATASATITAPEPFSANIQVVMEPYGATSDGELVAYGRNGVEPYTYLWNTGSTTSTISGLTVGTYTVTITDDQGEKEEATIVFDQSATLTYVGGLTEVLANNGAVSGSVKIKLTGDQFNTDDLILDENEVSLTLPEGLSAVINVEEITTSAPTWDSYELPSSLSAQTWSVLTYAGGKFIALANSSPETGSIVSEDGRNWQEGDIQHQDWSAVAYGNGRFVAVSTEGYVSVSMDGLSWTDPDFFEDSEWTDLAFGNGVFVATAYYYNYNSIMVSEDGVLWSEPTDYSYPSIESITFGEGKFVAVNQTGDIFTSIDGMEWTDHNEVIEANDITQIIYGNGLYVICSEEYYNDNYGRLWTSTTGLDWEERTLPISGEWDYLVYGAGKYILIDENNYDRNYLFSENGINWLSAQFQVENTTAITYGKGSFVIHGDHFDNNDDMFLSYEDHVATLTISGRAIDHQGDDSMEIVFDFLDAAFDNPEAAEVTNAVNYNSGIFINFRDNPYMVYSGDGFTETEANDGSVDGSITITLSGDSFLDEDQDGELQWDIDYYIQDLPDDLVPSLEIVEQQVQGKDWIDITDTDITNTWEMAAYGNGTFVALRQNSSGYIYSMDGINWVEATLDYDGWRDLTFAGGKFVAVGYGDEYEGHIMASTDGVSWDYVINEGEWKTIAYGDGKYVVIGYQQVLLSTDAITWESHLLENYTNWHSIAYGNGVFVSVADGGDYLMTSEDGFNWTLDQDADYGYKDIAFGGGQFVAIGNNDHVYVSDNGSSWSQNQIPWGNWESIAYGNGMFVAAGQSYSSEDANIIHSSNLEDWSEVLDHSETNLDAVFFASGSFYILKQDTQAWLIKSDQSYAEAVLTLSGNALDHEITDDIADLKFEFDDGAFGQLRAAYVINATGPASSELSITFTSVPPANDACTDAVLLEVYERNAGTYEEGTTLLAEIYDGNLSCATDGTVNDVWYKFTTPASGNVEINTLLGSAGFLSGAVYVSCGSSALFCVADLSEKIYLPLAPDVEVFLQLWNSQEEEGTFSIRINEAPNAWVDLGGGADWSAGSAPASSEDAMILSPYSTTDDGSLEVQNLELIYNTLYAGMIEVADEHYLKVNGDLTNNGGIYVASGGSLITLGIVENTAYEETFIGFKGTVIERVTTFDQSTGRYSIMGSPVTNASFDVLGTYALIYGYDETQAYNPTGNQGLDRFKTPAQLAQTTMQPGQGYFSAFTGDETGMVTFIGTPNTGTIQVGLSYTDQGSTEEEDFEGFNLVSNPYPAAISANDFIDANSSVINQTIYLWDDNGSDNGRGSNADYLMVNRTLGATNTPAAGGASKWDGSIRSGQGFFVKTSATGTLTFTDALKKTTNVNSDAGFYRLAPITRYKLILENEFMAKATIIGYLEDATIDQDAAYDALSLGGNALQLYSLDPVQGKKMGIQGLPADYREVTRIGYQTDDAGTFTIRLADLSEVGQECYLLDRYTNQQTDLTKGSYTFTTQTGTFDDRFVILSPNTITGLAESQEIRMYRKDGYLHLLSDMPIKAGSEYQIMDLMGRSLQSGKIDQNSQDVSIYVGEVPQTVYILRLELEGQVWTGKVILK